MNTFETDFILPFMATMQILRPTTHPTTVGALQERHSAFDGSLPVTCLIGRTLRPSMGSCGPLLRDCSRVIAALHDTRMPPPPFCLMHPLLSSSSSSSSKEMFPFILKELSFCLLITECLQKFVWFSQIDYTIMDTLHHNVY